MPASGMDPLTLCSVRNVVSVAGLVNANRRCLHQPPYFPLMPAHWIFHPLIELAAHSATHSLWPHPEPVKLYSLLRNPCYYFLFSQFSKFFFFLFSFSRLRLTSNCTSTTNKQTLTHAVGYESSKWSRALSACSLSVVVLIEFAQFFSAFFFLLLTSNTTNTL